MYSWINRSLDTFTSFYVKSYIIIFPVMWVLGIFQFSDLLGEAQGAKDVLIALALWLVGIPLAACVMFSLVTFYFVVGGSIGAAGYRVLEEREADKD